MINKIRNISLSIIYISTIIGCASNTSNSQVIIDPAYNFLSANSNKKLPIGTIFYFKINSISNNKMKGYITNNIFNVDDNIILFKMGDTILADINPSIENNCGISNTIIQNSNGYSLPITDFYLTFKGDTYNCFNKKNNITPNQLYGISLTSTSNIPNISGGVSVPDILEQFKSNKLDTTNQYKIVANKTLNWLPISVADNGIQTIIKFPDGTGSHIPSILIDKTLYLANSSFKNSGGYDYIIVDGVYAHLVLSNLKTESFGEVHIIRQNIPDNKNTIVNDLFIAQSKLLQPSAPNQIFQPISNNVGILQTGTVGTTISQVPIPSDNVTITNTTESTKKTSPNITQQNSVATSDDNNFNDNGMGVSIMGKLNFNNN